MKFGGSFIDFLRIPNGFRFRKIRMNLHWTTKARRDALEFEVIDFLVGTGEIW